MSKIFKKSKFTLPVTSALVTIMIISSFFNISNIPVEFKYIYESLFIFSIVIFSFYVILKKYFKVRVKGYSSILIQYVFLSFLLLFLSAILANINFGQPVLYGMLASRRALYCLVGVLILFFLERKYISLKSVEKIFILSFTLVLLSYYLVNIVIPASTFLSDFSSELTKGFVTFSDARNISRYKFDQSITFFGIIYSLLHIKKKKFFLYLAAALFYLLFFHRGRILIASFVFVFMLYIIFSSTLRERVFFFIVLGVITILSFLLDIYSNESVFRFVDFFQAGIVALFRGEIGSDFSANSRIIQADTAWWYIKQHQFIGIGQVSNQWSITPDALFGRLYPSDIGLIGLWFLYGITGIIAYIYLTLKVGNFFFVVKGKDKFIFSCWLYCVYVLFASLMTGAVFITAFGQFSIMLAIITYYLKLNSSYSNVKNVYNSY